MDKLITKDEKLQSEIFHAELEDIRIKAELEAREVYQKLGIDLNFLYDKNGLKIDYYKCSQQKYENIKEYSWPLLSNNTGTIILIKSEEPI